MPRGFFFVCIYLLRKVFFKAKAGVVNELCLFFANIAEMPRFIGKTGYAFLILGIAENKAVFGGMLKKPGFAGASFKFAACGKNIHRKTAVVLACARGGGGCAGLVKLLLAAV